MASAVLLLVTHGLVEVVCLVVVADNAASVEDVASPKCIAVVFAVAV